VVDAGQRIAGLVNRLVRTRGWHRTRKLLERHPELISQAAEDRLSELAEQADRDQDQESAAMYRFHLALIRRTGEAGAEAAVAGLRAEGELIPDLVADGTTAYRGFTATRSQADLATAVTLFERAATLAGSWHPDRAAVLNNLGLALSERASSEDRDPADLDRAVAVLEESATAAGRDADGRYAALANLGSALLTRHHPQDMERAAEVLSEAAQLAVADPVERARRLSNLGIALSECHLHSGRADQLERALAAYAEAVALTAPDWPDRPGLLANLGTGLADRYIRHGDPADLDRAIDLMAEAIATVPADAVTDLADWQSNLGLLLRDRYLRDGDLADLDAAEERLATAVSLAPADAMARPDLLDQHAVTLRIRSLRRSELAELRRAVDLDREAARLATEGSPEHTVILNNLGGTLRAWARQTDDGPLLDEAVQVYREAMDLVRATERGAALTNLGSALLDRYDQAGGGPDLDEAVRVLAESVRVTDQDSPELPGRLNNLANGLRLRYERDGRADDAEQAADAYRLGQQRGLEVATEAALNCGVNWGDWSMRRRAWAQADEAYDLARVAADRLLRQHLARRDVEAWLTAVGNLPAQAALARCRMGQPGTAAEWLEWGRARVLSDALGRARLTSLEVSHPDLVRRYRRAAARLNTRFQSPYPGESRRVG
jgi:tetratricopeptide (TPR) repeat protein